jgi:hypothetical protein
MSRTIGPVQSVHPTFPASREASSAGPGGRGSGDADCGRRRKLQADTRRRDFDHKRFGTLDRRSFHRHLGVIATADAMIKEANLCTTFFRWELGARTCNAR